MKEKAVFENQSLGTCAALLATGKVTFEGIRSNPYDRRKTILLAPKEVAEKIYHELLNEKLMVNASRHIFWVEKLKAAIFRDV